MITYSKYNRIISSKTCCRQGEQGATGPQGVTGQPSLQSLNLSSGISANPFQSTSVHYDLSNIHVSENGTSSDGFNIVKADSGGSNHFYVLPFGGDTSNNAPLDSSDNPVLLNHSTWLRIQLQQEDWGNIPENIRSTDNNAYIPIYWKN